MVDREYSINNKSEGAMYPYSFDLCNGYHYFAECAGKSEDDKKTRYYNSACVFFASSCIEAILNERISMYHTLGKDIRDQHIPMQYWETLFNIQKNKSIKEKWNLIISVLGGQLWDSSKEPFQSYDILFSLRNELVHYKAHFKEMGDAPTRKIKSLLETLIGKIKVSNNPEEYKAWVTTLLESPKLGNWVKEKVNYWWSMINGRIP